MKIWITFSTVFGLQCGGLERCRIWFQKPKYIYVDREHDYDDLPFGGSNSTYQGLEKLGWKHSMTGGKETGSISLGKVFDYKGDVCELVWKELCNFFKCDDLRKWDL